MSSDLPSDNDETTSLKPALEKAIQASRRRQYAFWGLTVLWLLAAGAAVYFFGSSFAKVNDATGDAAKLQAQLKASHGTIKEMEKDLTVQRQQEQEHFTKLKEELKPLNVTAALVNVKVALDEIKGTANELKTLAEIAPRLAKLTPQLEKLKEIATGLERLGKLELDLSNVEKSIDGLTKRLDRFVQDPKGPLAGLREDFNNLRVEVNKLKASKDSQAKGVRIESGVKSFQREAVKPGLPPYPIKFDVAFQRPPKVDVTIVPIGGSDPKRLAVAKGGPAKVTPTGFDLVVDLKSGNIADLIAFWIAYGD
ncbi:MAG: hypothetical protein L0Y72_23770 [Gemmataceae bacterium]|nr:hypothetical protein [Gemmataceae bacterium]MCI0742063.1 hypothetical protein [Gemmataceae bacterium]